MPSDESSRLAEQYARMSDGELELVAAASAELTDEARLALAAEIEKRKLQMPLAPPVPQPDEDQWPEAKRFDNLGDAESARKELEGAGIEACLERETSRFLVDRIISSWRGVVVLRVKPEDLDDALELLNPPVEYDTNVQNWVPVKRFRDLPDASIAKGALDSAGIECHLTDENMVRLDWFWSNLIGGAKLVVKPEDAETALHILNGPTPAGIEYEEGQEFLQPSCPKCGSVEVTNENSAKGMTLATLWVSSLPIPIESRQWACGACGATWLEEPERADDIAP